MAKLPRLHIDPFIVAVLVTVGIACVIPARGVGAVVANDATKIAIGLLFFLYGVRLSSSEAIAGLRHWKLHSTVFATTFVVFPLLGLASKVLVPGILSPQLYTGVLFLCALPSTLQSSIAFTSIARGNVAAAIYSASLSSLIGIVLTPLLVSLLITGGSGGISLQSIFDIVEQLLIPFLLGQLARRWLGEWATTHKKPLSFVDRGSILLVVYTAFSAGIVAGIWHQISVLRIFELVGVNAVLLGLALLITSQGSRLLGFDVKDRITIMFCGSKKSLTAGLPMAAILFPAHEVGLIVLPIMLFHQFQLMVCAAIAHHWENHWKALEQEAPTSVVDSR